MEKKEGERRIPDRELLLILEQDPSRGVEILIEQYSGLLWILVQNYLDNPEDQKDCVNETFEQFYYNRKRFTPEKGTLSAYLAGVLRKRAITLYRKNSVRKWEELTDEYENGDSQIEKMAENLDLQQALSALKPDELELIRMKYYEGMTVQEIAASLNISYETAKKRHQRTLSKLQKMLLLVLAMVLAGLLTACAIRILQHFGIIPGYGINQDQEERVYVLEEPVEAESTDGSWGIEDAVVKDGKAVIRLWMKESPQTEESTQTEESLLVEESQKNAEESEKMADTVQGGTEASGNPIEVSAINFWLGFSDMEDIQPELASKVTSWRKDGIWYKELIFKNLQMPQVKEIQGDLQDDQGNRILKDSENALSEENFEDNPNKGDEAEESSAPSTYALYVEFNETHLDFTVTAAWEDELENYAYSLTDDGGILADPVLENGHLLVSIYPLNLGDYEITPSLIRNMYAYSNEEEAQVTVTGEDKTVRAGECIGYHPNGTEEYFQWDFGEATPGTYTLKVPFVYEKKKDQELSIPINLLNMIWSKEEYPISGGTIRIKNCEKSDAEEMGGNHWKLQLQFNPEDSRRSLAALPLSIKVGDISVGLAHITSAVSDTAVKKNIMEYDLELLQNPGEDSEVSLTSENLGDTSLREIWYRLDEPFTVKFHVE